MTLHKFQHIMARMQILAKL